MRAAGSPEQPTIHENGSNKRWYKATVTLAHNGSGSRDEGTVFVYARDAADVFNQLRHDKGGIKRNRTPGSITECSPEEVKRLLEDISTRHIELLKAQRKGLKSVALGELEAF